MKEEKTGLVFDGKNWVRDIKPLSDEEINNIWFNYGWESVEKKDLYGLVRAIEERHGIK